MKKTPTEPTNINSHLSSSNLAGDAALLSGAEAKLGYDSSSFVKMEKSRGKILERANSFVGYRSRSQSISSNAGCVVVVDPFSTGAHLALSVTEVSALSSAFSTPYSNPLSYP